MFTAYIQWWDRNLWLGGLIVAGIGLIALWFEWDARKARREANRRLEEFAAERQAMWDKCDPDDPRTVPPSLRYGEPPGVRSPV